MSKSECKKWKRWGLVDTVQGGHAQLQLQRVRERARERMSQNMRLSLWSFVWKGNWAGRWLCCTWTKRLTGHPACQLSSGLKCESCRENIGCPRALTYTQTYRDLGESGFRFALYMWHQPAASFGIHPSLVQCLFMLKNCSANSCEMWNFFLRYICKSINEK